MRIVYKAEGGLAYFPGLRRVAVIDSHSLSAAEAAKLVQLLDSAHFFELPEDCRKLRPGAADCQQYAITAEDADRRHTVRLADPVEDPRLQALLDFLEHYVELPAPPVSVG
ncbi:MAG TPA: protealysin inhibitor emfourin [Roseiflexaceae bacterium]|nr:protealysin inhibitor emfourin [Roseiflexaceae bacterium]